jgi:NAD-dependent DNA ligase
MSVLAFDYEDAKGNVSTREVSQWSDDGWLLTGICSSDNRRKTFRRDRIQVVHEGGESLKPISMPQHLVDRAITASKKRSDSLEILFTGFAKTRRAELETAAAESGMRVCKTVTVGLSFVCGGPTAGPTKLRNAQAKGVPVLDEADFLKLLETGEMPE